MNFKDFEAQLINCNKICSKKLLQELVNYGNKPDDYRIKRIYYKLIKNNHHILAKKLLNKYSKSFKIKDDTILAFNYYLHSQLNKDKI